MLIISYDISNNKLRTQFSTYLKKYGYRLQYSIFEIRNSGRILKNIEAEIEGNFSKKFEQTDSVIIFNISKQCKITKYGYAKNDDSDLLIID
jgi:CRISPR-associated protein Cas2